MKSEEEIRQYIRGLRINRRLAVTQGKKGLVKRYKDQINLCRWFIEEKDGG